MMLWARTEAPRLDPDAAIKTAVTAEYDLTKLKNRVDAL